MFKLEPVMALLILAALFVLKISFSGFLEKELDDKTKGLFTRILDIAVIFTFLAFWYTMFVTEAVTCVIGYVMYKWPKWMENRQKRIADEKRKKQEAIKKDLAEGKELAENLISHVEKGDRFLDVPEDRHFGTIVWFYNKNRECTHYKELETLDWNKIERYLLFTQENKNILINGIPLKLTVQEEGWSEKKTILSLTIFDS